MNEARPYASLSSGLLARKGTAKPAMRPQGYSGGFEDLGWNDMGYAPGEAPQPAPAPEHVPSSIAALTPAPKIARIASGADRFDESGDEDFKAGVDETCEESEFDETAETAEAVEPAALQAPAEFAVSDRFEAEPVEAGQVETDQVETEQVEAELFEAAPPEAHDAEPVEPESFEAPPVVTQQRAILQRFDGEDEPDVPANAGRAARAEVVALPQRRVEVGGHKAAFTLRLDADRHLRLRLACAVTGRSAQQIVARALEEALAGIPEIEALASQVPAKGRAGAKGK